MSEVRWHADRVMNQVRAEIQRRALRGAAEVSNDIAARVSFPGPPPARPGQPPRRRTGQLAKSVTGRARWRGSSIIVTIGSMLPRARLFFQQGRNPFFGKSDRLKLRNILLGRR
jgi:hypothetical protein